MLDAFYGAFSPACLALLGLWLVAVQMLAIAVLAIIGGVVMQRTEAVLLTALLFIGFNVAWLFLFAPLVPADAVQENEPEVQR